ncbi:MAG: enoyl-CoA hydratase/isomerase family protein [Mariniblastus sp.]|nr:enoyl-CoA hydratase/isomerase family protein [Mariniblastus sp.]
MLRLENQDTVARLVMNHGKVNVMDIEFCRELVQQLETLESDSSKVVILSGNERVFSAGIDLKRWLAEGEDYIEPFLSELERVMERIFLFPKPVIAMIEGHAVAGGCMMAAACDVRLIAPQARIGIPELRVGVPLPMMAIEIMRFVANTKDFQDVVNSGRMFEGNEAVTAGLANEVVPRESLVERADQVAQELISIPAAAFRMTKQQSRVPVMRIVKQNREAFSAEFLRIWSSAETRESIQSYVNERLK